MLVLQNIGTFPNTHFGLKKTQPFLKNQGQHMRNISSKWPADVGPYPNPLLLEAIALVSQ